MPMPSTVLRARSPTASMSWSNGTAIATMSWEFSTRSARTRHCEAVPSVVKGAPRRAVTAWSSMTGSSGLLSSTGETGA